MPVNDHSADAITNSYAFHHLTDEEKSIAAKLFKAKLKDDGVVVIADTMYETLDAKRSIIDEAHENGHFALENDLKTEYYTTHESLTRIFENEGFTVSFQQMNKFVWILTAKLL